MSDKKIKILVVDDEDNITMLLKTLLRDQADEIKVANNGREALHIFKNDQDFALILTDIKMPVMDGLEFIKKVRELGSDIPVIFFTGFGSQENMVEALKYGAYDFIDKPNLENLEEIVGRCINEKFGKGLKSKSKVDSKQEGLDDYKKMITKR